MQDLLLKHTPGLLQLALHLGFACSIEPMLEQNSLPSVTTGVRKRWCKCWRKWHLHILLPASVAMGIPHISTHAQQFSPQACKAWCTFSVSI